jgi:hypothetical protein
MLHNIKNKLPYEFPEQSVLCEKRRDRKPEKTF